MKNRDLQNERLNEVERKLLKAATMPRKEIEKIVGNPQLFNFLTAKIKTEELNRKQKNAFASRWTLPSWNWQKIGFSFAVIMILLLAAADLLIRQTRNSSPDLIGDKIVVTDSPSSIPLADFPSPPTNDSPAISKPANFKFRNKTFVSQKVVKKETVKSEKPPGKINLKTPPQIPISEEKVFYSLLFPGDAETETGDRQIVRTELSRPALFALGVNVAAGGDDNRKFKTDLIVGADGVPQAIRFVE